MKKMMIALAILGFTWTGAQAQTNRCVCHSAKTVKTHRVAHVTHHVPNTVAMKTYQVCKEQGGYYTCCIYKTAINKPLAAE